MGFRCAFIGTYSRVWFSVQRMNLLHILPVLALLWAVVYCQHTPKPITAVLHAKWPRTPLLVEASEFVASEDNSAFWQFVEATTDIRSTVHTDKELYDAVLEQVEPLLSPLAYSLFIFALSLHTYSTTVEMYQQVAMERLRVLGEVDCPAFVDVAGQVACSVEQLNVMLQGHSAEERKKKRKVLLFFLQVNGMAGTPPQLFGFDHRYPSPLGAQDHAPTAVLYAELGTQECSTLHSALAALASEGRTRYVLRHYLKHRSENKMRLSGYGVELAVKSTEYKAVDDTQVKQEEGSQIMEEAEGNDEVEGFLFNTLKARHPSLSQQLGEWKDHLLQGAREMPELRAWQLQDLGYQTSQRMLSAGSDLALKVMRDTAQNLPTLAKSLSRTQVSKELRQEIKLNQKTLSMYGVEPGSNVLLLNGIVLQEDSTDIFNLLDVLLSESRLLTGLQGVGLGAEHTQKLLNLPVHTEHKSFSVDMRSEAVVWINDLEKDRLYSGWPKSLQEFLKPMFPGMLRQIRRNVFNIVFCLDPASPEGAELVEYVKLFLDHVVPARLGVLLVPDQLSESDEEGGGVTEEGVITSAQLIRLFNYLSQHKSAREALRWLYQTTSTGNLTTSEVMATFEAKYGKTLSSHQDTVGEVAGEQSEYDSLRKMSMEFFQGKGFDSLPQVLVNGVQLDLEEDLESSIVSRMQTQTFEIQQAVYLKRVNDSSVMYDYFLDKPNVLKRVNRHVVSTSKQLDLSRAAPPEGYSSFSELSQSAMSAQLASSLHYYSSEEGEFLTKELSVWVLGDIASGHGKELLKNALVFASSQFEVRVAVVHNLNTPPGPTHLAVEAALMSQRSVVAWRLIEALLSSKEELTMEGVLTIAGGVQGVRLPALEERVQGQDIRDIVAAHTTYCSQVLGLEGGASALLSNGRVIGPLAPGESFKVADFQMLYQFESSGHASSVLETVEDLPVEGVGPDEDTAEFRSGLVMQVASLLRSEPKRRRISLPKLRSQHSQIHLPSSDPSQELQLVAVMDPLAVGTQRLAPILQTLHVAMPIDLQLYPNPQEKLSELPIKRFYRYVLEPELSFELDGSESPGPMAVFADLPHSPLLTLQLAVPHSWLVEGVWSPHDLDNIHLAAVERGVHGVFELEHILVEGQCFDAQTDQPIPGLEYSLGTPTQPDRFDTIVMANLGYFQLKAGPGVWTLRLREGRSHDMYTVTSHHGSDSSSTGDNIVVMVNSFRGKGIVVRVAKRPGMEGKHLLYDDKEGEGPEGVEPVEEEPKEEEQAEAEGIWKSLSSLLGGKGEEDKKKVEKPSLKKLEVSEKETINIFSIASGHLYERFLRIMMLSVLKNTRNPVKFWFLKNYLSPTFKDFIPHMARHYGFEYELVQYRWPRWLHAQTEKQRLIWGYKILFLDVLFPLSVKKIIFVDADQTVRADLRELLEIHLHGAPYAYTPFCDSRPDMAGFRFWDRGYWKNHLGNRRYHISALYLVDLWRFRQLAAGDRLRGQYQALSQDPNSLANLDQDLPNNMIHSVPIFSLPQEWLWCETWCTNETKPLAKTIDLCNNPLTKEPKLTSARRIVPEWTSYDAEIQLLQESMEAEQPSKENQDHLGRVRTEDIAGDSQKHVEL